MIKHVLVTGASGFIGSNVSRELLNQGYVVTGLVTKRDTAYLNKNKLHPSFKLYEGDITKKETLELLFKEKFDALIHIAGVTPLVTKRKEKFFAINYEGTKNVVDLARYADIKRMIFLSTTSVHKGTDYGNSKLQAEKYCESIPHVIILRSPGVYGHYKDVRVLWLLIMGKLRTLAFSFHKKEPEFIRVEKLAEKIVNLLDTLDSVELKTIELEPQEKVSFRHLFLSIVDFASVLIKGNMPK